MFGQGERESKHPEIPVRASLEAAIPPAKPITDAALGGPSKSGHLQSPRFIPPDSSRYGIPKGCENKRDAELYLSA